MLFISTHFLCNKRCAVQYGSEINFEEKNYIASCISHKTALLLSGSFNTAMLLSTYLQSTPKVPRISSLIKCPTKPKSRAGELFCA